MVLKYALLGMLAERRMSGYDLVSEFNDVIKNFWHANHNQVYPTLKKLTDEGCIKYETVTQKGKPDKKVYSITAKGLSELQNWLITPTEVPDTVKDVFMLKTYFIASIPKENARQLFVQRLVQHEKKLEQRTQKFDSICRLEGAAPSISSPYFGHYLTLTRAIEREKSYIRWLQKALKWLD